MKVFELLSLTKEIFRGMPADKATGVFIASIVAIAFMLPVTIFVVVVVLSVFLAFMPFFLTQKCFREAGVRRTSKTL